MSRHIVTVIFLATPHRGTHLAEILARISGKITPARTFVAEMIPNSAVLEELNDNFRHDASNLLIFSFYETRETEMGTMPSRLLVVAKDSAVLGYQGEISISMDTDHYNVVKFANSTDANYLKVLNSLKSIRLISIDKSAEDPARICCTLKQVPLFESPPYKALSYCWGDPSNKLPISVNQRTVNVNLNLHAALARLSSDGVKFIWVDALCINQDDKEERSIQIGRMSAIYKQADQIPDSDIAELNKMDHETAPSVTALFAAAQLLEKEYWTRVWIIQELAAASSITVLCGAYTVSWQALSQTLPADLLSSHITSYPRHAHGIISYFADLIIKFHKIRAFRADRLARKPIALLEALHRSQYALSTDPEDKLYALLGLVFDGTSFIPHPDYSSTKEEVYRNFSAALFENGYPLDFIYLRSLHREVDNDLPSWAINWIDLDDDLARKQFQLLMSIKLPSTDSAKSQFAVDGDTLTVTGIVVGTIIGSTSPFEDDETVLETGDASVKVVLDLKGGKRIFKCQVYMAPNQTKPFETTIPTRERMSLWLRENNTSFVFNDIIEFKASILYDSTPDLLHRIGIDKLHGSYDLCDTITGGMRLAVLNGGLLSWVPPQTRGGDMIVRINGCTQPIVLRKSPRGYHIVGAVKVGSKDMPEDSSAMQQFSLV
ncbi:HET domain containing protein [Hyaloscypha variabilis]